MTYDKDLLRKLCGDISEESAAALAGAMKSVDSIKRDLSSLRTWENNESLRHKEELAAIGRERARIRKSCKHQTTQYHGDPAGGSDSWTECQICGASTDRLESRYDRR